MMKSQTVCGLRCWPDSCRCIKGLQGDPQPTTKHTFCPDLCSIPKLEDPWTWARISVISMCLECRMCITLSGCCKMHKKTQGFLHGVLGRERERNHTLPVSCSQAVFPVACFATLAELQKLCSFSANVTHTDKQTQVHIVYFNTTRNKRHCILGYQHINQMFKDVTQ